MDPTSESQKPVSNGRIYWCVAAIILCVAYALSHSYSSMAKYDDESYVMMTVKTFLDGDRLYAETFTQYGPAYYMLQQPIHGWMGVPITHDIVRLKTIGIWLLLGVLGGILVSRMTQSWLAGSTAALFTVLHLENFGLEPAHPQEVVALLGLIAILLMKGRNRWLLFIAGVTIAFAALSKLNVGAIAAVAALFAASYVGPAKSQINRLMFVVSSGLAICLAFGIFAAVVSKCLQNGQCQVLIWPSIVSASVMSLIAAAWKSNSEERMGNQIDSPTTDRWPPVLAIVAGGIVGSILVIAWAFLNGNSFDEILYGVVFQHSYMSRHFYHPLEISVGAAVSLIAAPPLLFFLFRHSGSSDNGQSIVRFLQLLAPLVIFISLGKYAVDCWKPLVHGLDVRGASHFLIFAGPLLMPLLILHKKSQTRMTLAMIACLSPLMVFPVPGTQCALGAFPILLALLTITFDISWNQPDHEQRVDWFFRNLRVVVSLVLLMSTIAFGSRWVNGKPLDQPGCRWVRLEESRAIEEQQMSAAIRNVDSPWLAFDRRISSRFYFWTGKKSITSLLPTYWPLMLTPEQMARVKNATENTDSICVVRVENQDGIQLEDNAVKIQQELLDGWQQVEEVGGWQIGIRKK